jgi:hypothetical protein
MPRKTSITWTMLTKISLFRGYAAVQRNPQKPNLSLAALFLNTKLLLAKNGEVKIYEKELFLAEMIAISE